MPKSPEEFAHLEWLGYVQPVGLVVSIPALLDAQCYVNKNIMGEHARFLGCLASDDSGEVLPEVCDLSQFTQQALDWQPQDLIEVPKSGGHNTGQNDLWIAAATKAVGGVLMTCDADFNWLMPLHITRDTPTWLPAIENRGEGIFIQFSKAAIDEWAHREAVVGYGMTLLSGLDVWRKEHNASTRVGNDFPLLPFYMLHAFSHLLLTAVSLECGYPASSIRERIYCIPSVGYGVLLYTGSPDAEGTLGGLVETGRQISDHVRKALE